MNYSGFAATLELAYAPLSNHDFTLLKRESIFQQILQGGMLYAICQRPMLTFENITISPDISVLHFEIHLQSTAHKLVCALPLQQELLDNDGTGINVGFGYYDEDAIDDADAADEIRPLPGGVNGFHFYTEDDKFLLWLSPDKFLHHYWNKLLTATVTGDYREFTTFFVHYVGKATGQDVLDRLTGHYTLQEILSLEKPFVKGVLPTHEIMLLVFKVASGEQITVFGDDVDEFVDKALGNNHPDQKTVALDAEKALVKLLNPEYNHPTKRFPNYPQSTDGLYQYQYNRFAYQITDDIALSYNDVAIQGSVARDQADIIAIDANTTVEIIKLS